MKRFNVLILLTLLFLCVVSISNFQQIYILQKTVIEQTADVNIIQNKIDNMLTDSLKKSRPSYSNSDTVRIRGTIKKEAIPQDLQLGEYWYWFYFDEPYLLMNNTSGSPQYIEKIQVYAPTDRSINNIDNFLNTNVEIFGTNTWGYEQSNVIQILTLTKL